MPIITLTPHAEHVWGVVKDWSDDYFPGSDPFADIVAEIDNADATSDTAIEGLRQQFLGYVPSLPALTQQLATDQINAHINGALMAKKGVVAAAKAAITGVKPVLHTFYLANGACPINQNPASTVDLHDWDFDPEDLPSFDQALTITLNLPPVAPAVVITVSVPMKWKHGFTLTPRKVGDKTIIQPADHHNPELFKERVDTTHSYTLRYKAEIQLGPFSGSIDEMWMATQVASSQWCT